MARAKHRTDRLGRSVCLTLAVVSALAFTVGGNVAAWAEDGQESAAASVSPPRPILRSHQTSRRAVRGSFCWQGRCVESFGLPKAKRSVLVHPRGRVTIETETPATRVLLRTPRSDRRFAAVRKLSELRWSFRLPRRVRRITNLLIEVEYADGEALFGARLRRHRHRYCRR